MVRFRSSLLALAWLSLGSIGGCDPVSPTPPDGGGDAPGTRDCITDGECQDGVYCNGEERCVAGTCASGEIVACDDGVDCTLDRCSEARRECVFAPADEDGDGFGVLGCADGTDCDDSNARVFPGNVETCDSVDDDCDPTTLGGFDFDADGFVSSACCNPTAAGGMTCGQDCDDNRATTHPGALEVCDTLDQDCDGIADDGVDLLVYPDLDFDGVGAGTPVRACAGVAGVSSRDGDCDDSEERRYPGAPELCDLLDNDCDASIDESPSVIDWYPDVDGDGFGSTDPSLVVRSCVPLDGYSTRGTDCNDAEGAINPGASERCNGVDDDCNGLLDFRVGLNDWEDDDRDGIVDAMCPGGGADCDDTNPLVGEGSPEICDGADNDCDATVDEGVSSTPYYRDVDGDGFGSVASGAVNACLQPAGFAVRGGDCADAVASRYPGAIERCNGADDDCDAAIDESCTTDCADPSHVRCGGTCIQPITDERYCGASSTCTGDSAGARCNSDELCSAGSCRSQFIVPNGEGVAWSPPEDSVPYTLSMPSTQPVEISYTTDGTRPGPSSSTRTVVGDATVVLTDGMTLRWVVRTPTLTLPEQRYTHHRDPSAATRPGFVPTGARFVVSGSPSFATPPGGLVRFTAPARAWGASSAPIQYVISIDGVGTVGCEEATPTPHPGAGVGASTVSIAAPMAPGLYAVRAQLTSEAAGCRTPLSSHPGGGLMIGWIAVYPSGVCGDCSALDDQCNVGMCSGATCGTAPRPPTTPCSTTNICAWGSTCVAGGCGAIGDCTPVGARVADTVGTPIAGGGTGSDFTDVCPAGQAPIGIEARISSGAYDQVLHGFATICGLLSVTGTTVTISPGARLPSTGGRGSWAVGSAPATRMCPPNHVVVGLSGSESGSINQIALRCAPLLITGDAASGFGLGIGAVVAAPTLGTLAGAAFPAIDCPSGRVARGIYGIEGDVLEAVGLRCGLATLSGFVTSAPAWSGTGNDLNQDCPPGQVPVGVTASVTSGFYSQNISQWSMQCGTLSIAPAGAGAWTTTLGAGSVLPATGTIGSWSFTTTMGTTSCPANQAMVGFAGTAGLPTGLGGTHLNQLALRCAPVTVTGTVDSGFVVSYGAITQATTIGTGVGPVPGLFECPAGMLASGFHLHAGEIVDGADLRCSNPLITP